jgi:hypothetical protein
MESVWAIEPELDALGMQAVASPVGRSWNLAGIFFGELFDAFFELFATAEDAALIGDCCANLAGSRAAMEVCVHILRSKLRHDSFHAYLTSKGLPVKAESGSRIRYEFEAFSALGVGEEAEAVFSYLLGKDHADAGCASAGCCCESSSVVVVGLGLLGLLQEGVEQLKWIVGLYLVCGGHGQSLAGIYLLRRMEQASR